jgi:4-hydroxybenzoate polyprenyltransferase
MNKTIRAFIDLLRLHFFFAWPLLFCSGYLLATTAYGGFSWAGLVVAALIGFFGFEAGLVLNDYVDRDYDRKDVESHRLTKYWRLFGMRPIPAGLISPRLALLVFVLLAGAATVLILTLPAPHSWYVLIIMVYCYAAEMFYQVMKRHEHFPLAQLIGRTDFALFPVAGYLCAGMADLTAALYFVFFYPFAMAHLGVNDLVDIENDRARGMNTIPTLYGMKGTALWIAFFSTVHVVTAFFFAGRLNWAGQAGLVAGIVLVLVANVIISRKPTADTALKILPLFHLAMIFYAGSICIAAFL